MRTFSLLIYAISKSRTVITLPSEYTTSIAKQWNLMPYYQCNQGRRNAWLYIIKESSLWKIENLGHNKNGGNLRVDLEFFSSEARWKLPGNKCQDPELFTKMKYRDNKIHGKKKKKSKSQNDTRESTSWGKTSHQSPRFSVTQSPVNWEGRL